MTEIASTDVHILRHWLMEGNVDNMGVIWENTETKCKSTYAKLLLCEGIHRLFGGLRRVCG